MVIKRDFSVTCKGKFMFFLKGFVGTNYFLMGCGGGFGVCYGDFCVICDCLNR